MHKYKCIFVHIPKNAGSSVLKTLGHDNGRSHADWFQYHQANSLWFKRYHKFAVCREPLERLLSGYHYLINGGNQSEKDLAAKQYILKNCKDANEFIQNVLSYDFIMENIIFKPQYLFVFNERHECMVDTLLRFESLSEDWPMLAKKHGLPDALKIENTSSSLDERNKRLALIDPENIEKVNSIYHRDYQLFGY